MLTLITTKEAAAAIVGDLAESRGRGSCLFCLDFVSIGLGLLLHSVRRKPVRVVSLCALGFVLWSVIYCIVRVLFALAGLIPLDTSLAECAVISLWSFALFALALVSSNLLAGLAIGYRSRSGEMNRCVPLAMLWSLGMVVFPVADWLSLSVSWYCMLIYLLGLPLLYIVPLLCGGAIGGRLGSGLAWRS